MAALMVTAPPRSSRRPRASPWTLRATCTLPRASASATLTSTASSRHWRATQALATSTARRRTPSSAARPQPAARPPAASRALHSMLRATSTSRTSAPPLCASSTSGPGQSRPCWAPDPSLIPTAWSAPMPPSASPSASPLTPPVRFSLATRAGALSTSSAWTRASCTRSRAAASPRPAPWPPSRTAPSPRASPSWRWASPSAQRPAPSSSLTAARRAYARLPSPRRRRPSATTAGITWPSLTATAPRTRTSSTWMACC